MDVNSYREIQDLFRTDWEPAILDVVAERPYRFLALARRVRDTVDASFIDGNLTRSLTRLQEMALVHKTHGADDDGRPCQVYEVTAKGCQTLAAYHAIIEAYRRTHP